MKSYTKVDVSEAALEDLVRCGAHLIEEGLAYVDHQKPAAGGRLDVLLVDSGKSLVVAELKVIQDDGMLMQGIDYYDYVSTHVEAFARLYAPSGIDPTQQVRLLLIAPSFSQNLINRCKWVDLPVSLFTFHCLEFQGDDDLDTILSVVREHHGEVEYVAEPEALECRDSLNVSRDDLVEIESELAEMGADIEDAGE